MNPVPGRPSASFDAEVARIADEHNADVVFRLVEREDRPVNGPAGPPDCYFLHEDPKTGELVKARQNVEITTDQGKEVKPMCQGHKQQTALRQHWNFDKAERSCDPERIKEMTALVKDPRAQIRAEPVPDRRVPPSAPLPKPIRPPDHDPGHHGYDGGW